MVEQSQQLSRVFLTTLGHPKRDPSSANERYVIDLSAFGYIVEELVATSVVDILLQKTDVSAEAVESLPDGLKRRLTLVEENTEATNAGMFFLAPVSDEFGVDPHPGALRMKRKLPEELGYSLARVYFSLDQLLFGLRHRAQIDVDGPAFLQSATEVRAAARSKEARARLAVLEGLLRLYKPSRLLGLRASPGKSSALVESFLELVEDDTYRRMSLVTNGICFERKVLRGSLLLWRLAKKLLQKPVFREAFVLASRTVQLSTRIGTPDAQGLESLLQGKTLPPLVSLSSAINTGLQNWKAAGVAPHFPAGL